MVQKFGLSRLPAVAPQRLAQHHHLEKFLDKDSRQRRDPLSLVRLHRNWIRGLWYRHNDFALKISKPTVVTNTAVTVTVLNSVERPEHKLKRTVAMRDRANLKRNRGRKQLESRYGEGDRILSSWSCFEEG
jgi:hypothetical protein